MAGRADPTQPPEPKGVEPGSRRARKKERTRRQIYEAAMELFAVDGFGGVTISAICDRADVGRGTFFLHFPTKSALLFEFSQKVADEFSASLPDHSISARSELEMLLDRIAADLADQGDVMLAMLREFSSSPEVLAFGKENGWAFPDLIAKIVERGQKEGEFRVEIDARLATASLLSTAGAILSGWVFRPDEIEVSPESIRAQFFALLFTGLVPNTPQDDQHRD
jgi:AcrR family transcriptional regulator